MIPFKPKIAFAVTFIVLGATALADDLRPRPLPDADRKIISEYLGSNVVGDAIAPPALTHGLSDLLSPDQGIAWRMKIISGKKPGSEQDGSAHILNRADGTSGYRIDTGDGRNVLFGQLDAKGNFQCFASQDNQEGVISRFTPPQPIFLADIAPGETRKFTSNVSVADLSRSVVETHSGKLEIAFTYVGAYRLQVPAGTIDTVLVKTQLTGKVGPADIDDTIYRFFAKDKGLVAMVETNDVSAVLVYHEKTRVGKVLVETTAK